MLFRPVHRLLSLAVFSAICPVAADHVAAQDPTPDVIKLVPKVEPVEFARPSILPDRIVLTWAADPTTSQAVTWRTSVDVPRGLAEFTVADAGPNLEANSRQLVAETQSLTTDLNTAHFHTVSSRDCRRKRSMPIEWATASTGVNGFSSPPPAQIRNRFRLSISATPRMIYGRSGHE